jgi:hypothetical protein
MQCLAVFNPSYIHSLNEYAAALCSACNTAHGILEVMVGSTPTQSHSFNLVKYSIISSSFLISVGQKT